MIEAVVTFKDGSVKTMWAKDFAELFERLQHYENVVRFNAYKINSQSLRQGRY